MLSLKRYFILTLFLQIVLSKTIMASYSMDMMDDILNLDFGTLRNTKVDSVSKLAQTLPDSPANLTIITKEQIKKRGYRNLADLLNDVASFNVVHFSNAGVSTSVGIRGITGQQYFKILQDGIEIDMTQSNDVSVGMNYPLFGIKRVEVLSGGASVIYGADAVSGVINLVTNLEYGTSSQISYGTNGYIYGDIRYATKLNQNSFVIQAHTHRDQDYRFQELYPEHYNYMSLENSSGEVIQSSEDRDFNYSPTETKSASFLLKSENWSFGGHYSKMVDSTYISLTGGNELADKDSNMINELRGVYFKYRHNINSKIELSSTISYDATELDAESYYINVYTNYEEGYKYYISERFAIDEVLTILVGNHSILFGLSAEHFYSMPKSSNLEVPYLNKSATYNGSDIPVEYFQDSWSNFGVFLQDQIKINKSFQLSLAGRLSKNDNYGNNFTQRSALIYSQNSSTTHKFIYSQSFLAPSSGYKYQHYGYNLNPNDGTRDWDTNSYQVNYARIINSELEPEESTNIEYNFLKWFGDNIFLTTSLYQNEIHEMMADRRLSNITDVLEDTTFLKVKQRYNNREVNIYGGDISIFYKENFDVFSIDSWINWAYIDGFQTENSQKSEIPYIKTHTVNLGGTLSYKNFDITPSFKWVSGLNSGAIDKEDSSKVLKGEGYLIGSLFLKYRYDNRIDFSLNIKNIFDKRYFDIRKSTSSSFETAQAERLTIFSMKVDF